MHCKECGEHNENIECNGCKHSFSINTEEHKPLAVGMVIVDKYGEIVKEYYYSGEKVVENFIEEILKIEQDLLSITKVNNDMIITPAEEEKFIFNTRKAQ